MVIMGFHKREALRLVISALIVTYASAFTCIDFGSIPSSQTRTIFVKVSSSDCLSPISGAKFSQSCVSFQNSPNTINAAELLPNGPGIYRFTAPRSRFRINVSKPGYARRYFIIPSGSQDMSFDLTLRCRGRQSCSAKWYTLTVNQLCSSTNARPIVFAHHALRTRQTSNGVFQFLFCSVPRQVTVVVGNYVQSVTITQTTQAVDITCGECPSFQLTLTSDCDGNKVSGATLSLSNTEVSPGVYYVQACAGDTSVTIAKSGYQTETIPVPNPLGPVSAALECTESLTIVQHPQSKWRMVNDAVKLCCLATSSPGLKPITYRWYKDGAVISGATTSMLSLSGLQTTNSGVYTCKSFIVSQGLMEESNPATLTVTSADLTAVQPKTITICGVGYLVGQCSNAPCSSSGTQECLDDGLIMAKNTVQLTSSCGIQYTVIQSCECQALPDVTIAVTVVDADSLNPLVGINVAVQGTVVSGNTNAAGMTSLLLPAGTNFAVLKVTDASGNYLDTTKVLQNIVGSAVSVTVLMHSKPAAITIDPTTTTTLSLSDDPQQSSGPVQITIPPNSFFDTNGDPVTGPVNVFFKALPPNPNIGESAPGVFMARDSNGQLTELQTAGVFTISATDSSGNSVSSLPIPVEAQFGFKLWVLNEAGSWELVPVTSRRRRQSDQTNTYEFIGEVGIDTSGVRWYNIDKFPENTRCWFKTKIYDVSTGQPIVDDGSVNYRALIIAQSSEPAILQLTRYTNYPSTTCFEIRCDSTSVPGTAIGYIALEATYIPPGITNRATPYSLTEYNGNAETEMTTLNYNVLTSPDNKQSIRIDLVADANGPFFTDLNTCNATGNAANDDDNVLRFKLNPPTESDPYDGDSTERCVARVLLDNPWVNDGNTTSPKQITAPNNVQRYYAVSQWGSGEYYTYSNNFTEDSTNGEIDFCLEYRCSQPGDLTNVTINFGNSNYGGLRYYCNMTFTLPVVTSTGGGFFINTDSDAAAAIDECEADDSVDYAHEISCSQYGDFFGEYQ